MISRDFFSVANNLGDSVAFNLESDSKRGRRLIDGDSLDLYLEGLTEKQASASVNRKREDGSSTRHVGSFKRNR
jgi:hypothetical protein